MPCPATTRQFVRWVLAMSLFAFFETLSGDAILPQFVLTMVCNSGSKRSSNQTNVNDWYLTLSPECNETSKEIVTKATDWYNVILRDNNIASMLTITLMAVASDAIGRKPIISLITIGIAVDRLAIALSPSLSIVHYVHTAAGLLASRDTFYAVTFSAVADISSHQTRSKDYSCLEAGMFIGKILGPYGGGILVNEFGVEAPFYATSVGCLLILLYVTVVVQESIPPDQRTHIVCGCHQVSVFCLISQEDVVGDEEEKTTLLPPQNPGLKNWMALTPVGSLSILFQSRPWWTLTSMMFFSWASLKAFSFILPLYAKYQFNWGAYQTVFQLDTLHSS